MENTQQAPEDIVDSTLVVNELRNMIAQQAVEIAILKAKIITLQFPGASLETPPSVINERLEEEKSKGKKKKS